MELDTNNHSVFLLNYHLVLVIKYRGKVINNDISDRLKEIFEYISPRYKIQLEEWNHDKDHIHLLFRGQTNTEISKFINAYKSASSRLIKKDKGKIKSATISQTPSGKYFISILVETEVEELKRIDKKVARTEIKLEKK